MAEQSFTLPASVFSHSPTGDRVNWRRPVFEFEQVNDDLPNVINLYERNERWHLKQVVLLTILLRRTRDSAGDTVAQGDDHIRLD